MIMCANCKKRVAVVFVTKVENGNKTSTGYCIKCAKELGMPVDNIFGGALEKFGITEDQLEDLEDEMSGALSAYENYNGEDDMTGDIEKTDEDNANENGGAPAVDLSKILRESGLSDDGNPNENDKDKNKEKGGKDKPARGGNAGPIFPFPFGNFMGGIPGKNGNAAQNGNGKEKEKKRKFLDTYCRNLTLEAANGKLDRIIGREREMQRVIQILCRRQKSNPCLIGEPGVGKTAIAEALAIKIAAGDVPFKLKKKEVYLVDITAIVAGTQFRGQFESRMLGLINEVKSEGNIILVIDEIHNIVGAGDSEGSMSAANILKPALSRGEIQVIGATTLKEYRKFIEKDTALERRFQPVMVGEPSIAETYDMLLGIKHYYEEYHGINIPDGLLNQTVVLSERYITDRYLPDKAIDLLDEAASAYALGSEIVNERLELKEKFAQAVAKREALENEMLSKNGENASQNDKLYEKLANLKAEEFKYSKRLDELDAENGKVTLTLEDIARVIEVWTGIPATSISENEFEKIDKLEERLKKRIIGQDEAVHAVTMAIKRNRAGISYKRKPVSFIFAGPTGVGKTELVKTLSSDLFNSPETLIRLDMSEFMEKHSVSKLIGAPPGYVGYDDAGQLTEKIRRRPYSIILFDEIEKAHPDVMNILLQILDDGRVTDAQGRTVNFENTVIVMTTNAGSDHSSSYLGFSEGGKTGENAKTLKALESFLRPEFINRVDEIITFRQLDEDDFTKIARIMLDELASALSEKNINLKYTNEAASLVAKESFSRKYGARNMRRYIQKEIEDTLAGMIISDYNRAYTQALINVKEGKINISCM